MYDYLTVDTPDNQQTPEMLHDYLLGPFQYYCWFMSPPGRMYNYSNPNFMLAGLLVESTSGEFYRDYMASHVWEPLGMVRTTLYVDDVLADGDYAVALGPDPETGEKVELTPDAYDNVWGAPAGFGWTSAEELAAFAGFLMEGNSQVLADETRALLVTERVNTEEAVDLSWYGLGIGVVEGMLAETPDEYHPVTVWQHSGGINGFASNLVILPDHGFALVTLASGDGAYFPKTVGLATRTLVTLADPVPIPFALDGPEQFATYAGDYLDPFNVGSIKVFVEAGELHISLPDLDAIDMAYEPILIPGLPQNFLLVIEGFALPVTFILDGEGKSEYLRTRVAVGKRVEIPDGPASKLAPRLDRERLLRALRRARTQ
jgi:CubicO group peptidase (beta-lactamase class C family)